MILLWLAAVLGAGQEEAYTVVLAFEKMHCDQCKTDLEATLKQIQGYKSVSFSEASATVTFAEGTPIPAFTRLPSDLRLRTATITIRGTVSFAGEKATLVPRGGGAALQLQNPAGKDTLSALKQQLGGKNRFQVTGALSGPRAVALTSFQKTDWKD